MITKLFIKHEKIHFMVTITLPFHKACDGPVAITLRTTGMLLCISIIFRLLLLVFDIIVNITNCHLNLYEKVHLLLVQSIHQETFVSKLVILVCYSFCVFLNREKREKILMKVASKNKTLEAEDIVHILTKPSLYEDEIKDVPEVS